MITSVRALQFSMRKYTGSAWWTIDPYFRNKSNESSNKEPVDVLDDIGNMLANLTDELDAMLEEEKRQGLNSDD